MNGEMAVVGSRFALRSRCSTTSDRPKPVQALVSPWSLTDRPAAGKSVAAGARPTLGWNGRSRESGGSGRATRMNSSLGGAFVLLLVALPLAALLLVVLAFVVLPVA